MAPVTASEMWPYWPGSVGDALIDVVLLLVLVENVLLLLLLLLLFRFNDNDDVDGEDLVAVIVDRGGGGISCGGDECGDDEKVSVAGEPVETKPESSPDDSLIEVEKRFDWFEPRLVALVAPAPPLP